MREVHQPFIHENVFAPLEERHIRCIHHELFPGDGVDVAGDLFNDQVRSHLKITKPGVVLCLNLLEHVGKRAEIANLLADLIDSGGFLLATVPRSYQYHAAPIDTYYRPTPQQLAALFPSMVPIKEMTIDAGTLWSDLGQGGGPGTLTYRLARHFWRCLTYVPDPKKWLSHVHSTLWLFKRRKVSLTLLRKP